MRRWLVVVGLVVATSASACSGSSGSAALPTGATATDTSLPQSGASTAPASPSMSATVTAADPFSEQLPTDPRSPVTWLVKPTGNASKDAALAAYRRWTYTVMRVFSDPTKDQQALLDLATGTARTNYTKSLQDAVRRHVYQRGPVVVESALATTQTGGAAVVACINLTQSYVYTGGARDSRPAGYYKETAVLQKHGNGFTVARLIGSRGSHC